MRRIYDITLPDYTNEDIIDWFEERERNKTLDQEIVALVHKVIQEGPKIRKSSMASLHMGIVGPTAPIVHHPQHVSGADIFEQMYDWQASNNAIFVDDGVKKEKKRMLGI